MEQYSSLTSSSEQTLSKVRNVLDSFMQISHDLSNSSRSAKPGGSRKCPALPNYYRRNQERHISDNNYSYTSPLLFFQRSSIAFMVDLATQHKRYDTNISNLKIESTKRRVYYQLPLPGTFLSRRKLPGGLVNKVYIDINLRINNPYQKKPTEILYCLFELVPGATATCAVLYTTGKKKTPILHKDY